MTLIVQISDMHVRPKGHTCYGVSHTNMFAERAVRSIRSLDPQPDAVVMTGDLVDHGRTKEYRVARQILSRLPMPVYLIPGNHDNRDQMREAFRDYPGIIDAPPDRICYSVDIGGIRLIALDSQIPGKPQGRIGEEQLAWLDGELKKSQIPTLIAMHHPPARIGLAPLDAIGLQDGENLAGIISGHSHVVRVMCGHLHRPIITEFAGSIMTMVPGTAHQTVLEFSADAPAMFNFEPAAYFLHHFTPDTGIVTHMAYVEDFPGPHHYFVDQDDTGK